MNDLQFGPTFLCYCMFNKEEHEEHKLRIQRWVWAGTQLGTQFTVHMVQTEAFLALIVNSHRFPVELTNSIELYFKPSNISRLLNWSDDSDNLAPRTNYSLTTLTHWHRGSGPDVGREREWLLKVGGEWGESSLELEHGGEMDCSDIYWGIPDKDTKQSSNNIFSLPLRQEFRNE